MAFRFLNDPEGNHLGSRMAAVVVLTGLGAGLGGVLLTLLLHAIQHLAFGYTENTFLSGVEHASRRRRVSALAIGGLVVGLGWWGQRRYLRLVTVGQALQESTRGPARMPMIASTIDSVLQIVAVGFGASLGREGAPRQLGAAIGSGLAARTGLPVHQQRTIVACGAGAGLAAVYNVPLGGALFALEILLCSVSRTDVIAAILSCAIATAIAWPVLSTNPTYIVGHLALTLSAFVWAALFGPIAGAAGAAFSRLAAAAQAKAPAGWMLPVYTTSIFAMVGVVAIWFPQLLGNGKGPTQLALDATVSLPTLAALVILKPLATAACLRSGATGGLLTPALATGALLGALTGGVWSQLWAGTPIATFAIIGAAAMLAATQRAPLTAVVLVIEFTHTGETLLVPIMIAVGLASLVSHRLAPAAATAAATAT